MFTDLDAATLCWACYSDAAAFDRVIEVSGVWAGIKHYPGYSAIAFRGSTTLEDWLRDFVGIMIYDPEIGGVEAGFMMGMRDVMAHVADEIKQPSPKIYITGHSLGAARALAFAALVAVQGFSKVIQGVTTFGSPRPGGAKIKSLLANIPVNSYKNGNDPVTDVPFDIEVLAPYLHPRDLIPVNVAPSADDGWGILAHHHAELYLKAMQEKYHG